VTDPTIGLLRDLVAIDSVNPSLVPGSRGEAEIAAAVARVLRREGLDVAVEDVAPGRPNVIGVLEGRAPGRTLVFCGHLDTVGVDGMDAPFTPIERNGRLYGRGSQDMKGGVAAMIGAASTLARDGLARGRVVIAALVDEEFASAGADAFVRGWRADGAVVTEPTGLDVAVAHKGFAWVEVETRGVAAHGSRPDEGRDAIVRMGRVLAGIEALDRDLQARPPHPLMGTGSVHASLIRGGRELSSYPDSCVLRLERRTVAGERVERAREEIDAILAALGEEDGTLEASCRLIFGRPPYEVAPGHELPAALVAAAQRVGCAPRVAGMSFWTDAAVLADAGTPAVLFGPGGAGLHGIEEYVRLDEVLSCRNALTELARAFC
jgi:acetylornithine deacetylase